MEHKELLKEFVKWLDNRWIIIAKPIVNSPDLDIYKPEDEETKELIEDFIKDLKND